MALNFKEGDDALEQSRAKNFLQNSRKMKNIDILSQIKCGPEQYFPTKIKKIVGFWDICKSEAIFLIASLIVKMTD